MWLFSYMNKIIEIDMGMFWLFIWILTYIQIESEFWEKSQLSFFLFVAQILSGHGPLNLFIFFSNCFYLAFFSFQPLYRVFPFLSMDFLPLCFKLRFEWLTQFPLWCRTHGGNGWMVSCIISLPGPVYAGWKKRFYLLKRIFKLRIKSSKYIPIAMSKRNTMYVIMCALILEYSRLTNFVFSAPI